MEKKIGWVMLTGLLIGPILGSGIIIIPPMVFQQAGFWALPAWCVMVFVSFFFAFIFSYLTVLCPGDGGVSNAVEKTFGVRAKLMSSFFLLSAGLFGPAAVIMIIEKYVNKFGIHPTIFASIMVGVCFLLLMMQITSIGRIAFGLTVLTAVILFAGGIASLLNYRVDHIQPEPFSLPTFGYALLILFWIIVGWEVMGSYTSEVKDPKSAFKKAAVLSALVIAAIDLVVAAGIQFLDTDKLGAAEPDVAALITPVFGSYSVYVMGFLTLALCINTYLVFVGAITRLGASLASEGYLPHFLSKRNKNNAPALLITIYCGVHIIQYLIAAMGFMTTEKMVALANTFFLANALTGILAAAKLLRGIHLKACAYLLGLFFALILLYTGGYALIPAAIIALYFYRPGLYR